MLKLTIDKLNALEWKRWGKNLLIFVAPVALIYLSPIATKLAEPNHVFSLQDFAVNSFIAGMMVKYVIDSIIDFIRKFKASSI